MQQDPNTNERPQGPEDWTALPPSASQSDGGLAAAAPPVEPAAPIAVATATERSGAREGRKWPWVALTSVALAITVLTVYEWIGDGTTPLTGRVAASPVYDEDTVVGVYKDVSPAVVEVDVSQLSRSRRQIESMIGTGSGFVIDREGHIITNQHVIEGADRARVKFSDGRTAEAQIVGQGPNDDLALLKVDASAVAGITPVTLADSDAVKRGQLAIAIGAPFGFEGTVTVGVISGINRSLDSATDRPIAGVLQTDAALYPGSSGGPLLNAKGEVVGINTAIRVNTITSLGSGAPSVGFAVPVNNLKQILPRLLEGGMVGRPSLGISGLPVDAILQQELGLDASRGVYVVRVLPGSPAAAAGVRAAGQDLTRVPQSGGDIITAVNGTSVGSVEELAGILNRHQPGDTVTLTVVRDGQTLSLDVTLGEMAGSDPTPTPRPSRSR